MAARSSRWSAPPVAGDNNKGHSALDLFFIGAVQSNLVRPIYWSLPTSMGRDYIALPHQTGSKVAVCVRLGSLLPRSAPKVSPNNSYPRCVLRVSVVPTSPFGRCLDLRPFGPLEPLGLEWIQLIVLSPSRFAGWKCCTVQVAGGVERRGKGADSRRDRKPGQLRFERGAPAWIVTQQLFG